MFEAIINKFSAVLYVQIWENRIKVTDIGSGNTYEEKPLLAIQKNNKNEEMVIAVGNSVESIESELQVKIIKPFSHPRTLLSDFVSAQKMIQHTVYQLVKKPFFSFSPLIVIHPMEKMEGGITQIEFRAFKELALAAGARESVIYQGAELSIYNFDYEYIKQNEKEP